MKPCICTYFVSRKPIHPCQSAQSLHTFFSRKRDIVRGGGVLPICGSLDSVVSTAILRCLYYCYIIWYSVRRFKVLSNQSMSGWPTTFRPSPEPSRPYPEISRPSPEPSRPYPEISRPSPEPSRPSPEFSYRKWHCNGVPFTPSCYSLQMGVVVYGKIRCKTHCCQNFQEASSIAWLTPRQVISNLPVRLICNL